MVGRTKTSLKLLLVLALGSSLLALAGASSRGTYTLSTSPGAVPTLGTQGVTLATPDSTKALKVDVTVASGEAITNAMSAAGYCYKSDAGVWTRAMFLDLALDAGATGVSVRGLSAMTTTNLNGAIDCDRVYYSTSNINASTAALPRETSE